MPKSADNQFDPKAEMAKWLSFPSELGRDPDHLEEIDHRTLKWPPDFKPIPVWLFRYRVIDPLGIEDDVDVGMVGSMTACLFLQHHARRPPEDVYALHCAWELEIKSLLFVEAFDDEHTVSDEYSRLCPEDTDIERYTHLLNTADSLGIDLPVFAIGTGSRDGQPGFLVIDPPHTTWYPASYFPMRDGYESWPKPEWVLRIHVGRRILGLTDPPDRLTRLTLGRGNSRDFVNRVRGAFDRVRTDPVLAKRFFDSFLFQGLLRYVHDKQICEPSRTRSECYAESYEEVAILAQEIDAAHGTSFASDRWSYNLFDDYINALHEQGEYERIRQRIIQFRPHWPHNFGRSCLGHAAYLSGDIALAKEILEEFRDLSEGIWPNFDVTVTLAKIYVTENQEEHAKEILIEAMKIMDDKFQKANSPHDSKYYSELLESRAEAFVELFPESGVAYLQSQGISIEFVEYDV